VGFVLLMSMSVSLIGVTYVYDLSAWVSYMDGCTTYVRFFTFVCVCVCVCVCEVGVVVGA
jgi:hypothetical protein